MLLVTKKLESASAVAIGLSLRSGEVFLLLNMTTNYVFIHKRVTMTSHMELKAKAKKIFDCDHCLVSRIRNDTRKLGLVDQNL